MIDLSATVLIVAPHPDDEVLGCGWLMRAVVAASGRVVVAWMTDGGASHGDLDDDASAALVARRQNEALAGLAALGIAPAATVFLGFPDGGLAACEGAARVALAAVCSAHGITAVFVTSAADRHPDHRASFRIVAGLRGPARYAYPVSGRYDGEAPDFDAAIRIAEPAAGPLKRAALACHASQRPGGGARFPMSADAVDRFCSEPELFMPVETHP